MRLKKENNKGIIIVASLWILVIISALALSIAYRASIGLKLVKYYRDEIQARQVTSIVIKDFVRNKAKNNPTCKVIDEQSKLNLNVIDKKILSSLPLIGRDFANVIIEYRNSRPDGKLKSLEELTLIDNFDPRILKELENYLTVYGNGQININTAKREVLKALGLKDSLIEEIINRQKEGYAINDLNQLFSDQLIDGKIRNYLTTSSDYFRLNILTNVGKVAKRTSVVIKKLSRNEYKIEYWHES